MGHRPATCATVDCDAERITYTSYCSDCKNQKLAESLERNKNKPCAVEGCDIPRRNGHAYCNSCAYAAGLKSKEKLKNTPCAKDGCEETRAPRLSRCKAHVDEKRIEHRERNHAYVANIKAEQGCFDCGVNDLPAICYDFDHRPGVGKKGNVSEMVGTSKSIKRIQTEIDKCDVVCANCHRIRTHERRSA